MIHALASLAFCLAACFLGLPSACFLLPAALYAGREHAQAEERWMRARDLNRASSPWWMGFAPSAWTAKSLLDWILPLLACCSAAIVREALR